MKIALYLAEDVVRCSLNPIKEKNEKSGTFHFFHLFSEAERQHFTFLSVFELKRETQLIVLV